MTQEGEGTKQVGRSSWVDWGLGLLVLGGAAYGAFDYHKRQSQVLSSTHITLPTPVPSLQPPVTQEPFQGGDLDNYKKLRLMHATGDFGGAAKLATELISSGGSSPQFQSWLQKQLGPLLTSAAWVKIQTGDCDDALKLLYRAQRIGPLAETYKGLGVCLRANHSWPEAASALATYILDRPGDVDARMLYADVLESLGRFDEALVALESARVGDDTASALKQSLAQRTQAMKVKAREGTKQKSEYSRRFFVSFREGEHERLLPQIFETLESSLDEFSEVTGIAPSETPVEVVLYPRSSFHDVIPGGPQWSEGVFDGRIRVPLSAEMKDQVSGLLTTVLRHELSHALLAKRSNGRAWPAWFDEGLAQYLSCRKRSCDAFQFGPSPGVFSPTRFFTESFFTLSDIDAGRAYNQSLYLVRRLVQKSGEDGIQSLMRDLPEKGTITSDQIVTTWQYPSLDAMVTAASEDWKRRSAF